MDKEIKKTPRRLVFSRGLYTAEAVRLAAYVFSDRAGVKLASSGSDTVAELVCSGAETAGEFANEVLNQQCRLDLLSRNGKIANAIVTKTLLSALGETADKRKRR